MNQKRGNILSVTEGIIVHQCNMRGVMGAGLAKQIKAKWPKVFVEYREALSETRQLGHVIYTDINRQLQVASLLGQQHYEPRGIKHTSYDALDRGFRTIAEWAFQSRREVHYPMIGAGLGGGHWLVIQEIINHRLAGINHTLWVL